MLLSVSKTPFLNFAVSIVLHRRSCLLGRSHMVATASIPGYDAACLAWTPYVFAFMCASERFLARTHIWAFKCGAGQETQACACVLAHGRICNWIPPPSQHSQSVFHVRRIFVDNIMGLAETVNYAAFAYRYPHRSISSGLGNVTCCSSYMTSCTPVPYRPDTRCKVVT